MSSNDTLGSVASAYENITYFDQYSGSVLAFLIITAILLMAISYCMVMANAEAVKQDWATNRCKLSVIPFAGIINKPPDMSASEYTAYNFNYCTQTIISNMSGHYVQPLEFIVGSLQLMADQIAASLQNVRKMINKVRTSIQSFAVEIMGRLINVTIPLQEIIIKVKDLFNKAQGVMVAGLYTSLGSYMMLQSLMGAIAQSIVSILIALAAMIAVMWAVPVTWGAAAANTSIFVAISIPMAIILAFLKDVLDVRIKLSIPKVKCFDQYTLIRMRSGMYVPINRIRPGHNLWKSKVTSVICVEAKGSSMYKLNNTIVSDSHLVLNESNQQFVKVRNHPLAEMLIYPYHYPVLYCLNTTTKVIEINKTLFSDWDEIAANKFDHKTMNGGFCASTPIEMAASNMFKRINQIQIGDILKGNNRVYGLVCIDGTSVEGQYIFNMHNGTTIRGGACLYYQRPVRKYTLDKSETEQKQDNILEYEPFIKLSVNDDCQKKSTDPLLYHLLTDNGTFTVNNIIFHDYNSISEEGDAAPLKPPAPQRV